VSIAAASPFKMRNTEKPKMKSLTPPKPSKPVAAPAPLSPEEVVPPGPPISGGELKDAKGNVIPAWSEYSKTLPNEPVHFGEKISGLSTPSKLKTPKKTMTKEQEEKLQQKRLASDKRRAQMKEEMARRTESMKVVVSPGRASTPLKAKTTEVVEILTTVTEPPKAKTELDADVRAWQAEETREMRSQFKSPSSLTKKGYSVDRPVGVPAFPSLTGSSASALVMHNIQAALGQFEQQIRQDMESKYRSQIQELKVENERLKVRSPAKGSPSIENADALKAQVENLRKDVAVARAKFQVSEQKALTLESELALSRAEQADLTKLCDELISKLESIQPTSEISH